jgi:penicillin-binding protein 1C
VRVYVGSARFGDPQRLGHVDMLTAVRSPGSTLKPFLYGLALDQHLIHSESLLVDAPRQLRGYRPGNFGGSFEGPVAASEALRRSLNVPAVDLLERIGPRAFAASLEHAGLPLALPAGAEPNLSLILGGSGARLEDLLGAWRAIAGSGLAIRPRLRLDDPIEERRLLSPGAAWIVRRMLSSDPFSGGSERLFVPDGASTLAWKTGTSYGFRDAWALGLRGELVIGVWIGRPDGTPMPGEYGALTALPLLVQVGQSLPGHSVLPAKPANVTALEICWPLGQAPDPSAPELCHQRRTAWTLDGIVPTTLPDLDEQRWQAAVVRYRIDPASGLRRHANCSRPDLQTRQLARWPLRATPWLAAELRRLSQPPPLAADCPPDQLAPPLLIVRGIESDSTLRSSAGPGEPINLELSVLGNSSTTWWLLNQQLIGTSEAALPLRLRLEQVGDYELVALAADGRHRRVAFRMR